MTRVGIIGTGKIASAIVKGLAAGPSFDESITLSPRNAEIAAQLSREFASVSIGNSNQDVLDRSEIVLLTVRPQTAEEIISALSFRPEHHIVSAVAALSRDRVLELVAPARVVVKAIPLPTVAQRRGVTALYPSDKTANDLFERLGSALAVRDESQFSAMSAATSVVASYATLAETTASWLAAHGLERLESRNYVNALLAGIVDAAGHSTESFAEIAGSHTTPGGLNEQLHTFLEERGLFTSLSDGLNRVLARITRQGEYVGTVPSESAAD